MRHLREYEEWDDTEWDDASLDAETLGMNDLGFGFQGIMEITIETPEPVVNMTGGGTGTSGDCHFMLTAVYDNIKAPATDEIVAAIVRVSPRLNPLDLLDDDEPEVTVTREEMIRIKTSCFEVLQRAGGKSPFELHADLIAFDSYDGSAINRHFTDSYRNIDQLPAYVNTFGDVTPWDLTKRRQVEVREMPGHLFTLEKGETDMIQDHNWTSTFRIFRGQGAEESIAYVYSER